MRNYLYRELPQCHIDDEGETKPRGYFSHFLFSWISETIRLGYYRPLEETDIPLTAVGQEDTADLTLKLQNALYESSAGTNRRRAKLWRCLLKVISPLDYSVYIGTMLGDSICGFIQPLLMSFLLLELKTRPEDDFTSWRFVLASGMAFTLFLQPFFKSHSEYTAKVIAAKMRSSIRGIVYQKVK